LRIAFVTSEIAPWCKTGGLADVAAALPASIAPLLADGDRIAVFAPLHRAVHELCTRRGVALESAGREVTIERGRLRARGRFLAATDESAPELFFFDCPALFERDGLYVDPAGRDYPDNAERYATFNLAVLAAAPDLLGGPPDVVHTNDWQTSLLNAYLHLDADPETAPPRTVFTIHNLAYQGLAPADSLTHLGLDPSLLTPDGLEFYGQMNSLKAGVLYADAVTTVSPRYAEEIQTPAMGHGLDGFLRAHAARLSGVLNGIDTALWDPATDPELPAHYGATDLSGKPECRHALLDEVGLDNAASGTLLGVVARLAEQKGIDLIAELVPRLARNEARLIILGTGGAEFEEQLTALERQHPRTLRFVQTFDETLSHRIHAGADLFLMPSRHEPCGLNQMYAMRYGTPPVVNPVGGLRDTVADADEPDATGFHLDELSVDGLERAVARAARIRQKEPARWNRIVRTGMDRDSGWARSARAYLALYRNARA